MYVVSPGGWISRLAAEVGYLRVWRRSLQKKNGGLQCAQNGSFQVRFVSLEYCFTKDISRVVCLRHVGMDCYILHPVRRSAPSTHCTCALYLGLFIGLFIPPLRPHDKGLFLSFNSCWIYLFSSIFSIFSISYSSCQSASSYRSWLLRVYCKVIRRDTWEEADVVVIMLTFCFYCCWQV